jgi:cobalt-zinc-cadmium efflux system protein
MGKKNKLKLVIILNVGITAAQIIGGIIANSYALISDALHNFSDVAALVISLIALTLAQRKATYAKSFGYKRSEILAAFVNSSAVILVALYIIFESVSRFIGPQQPSIDNNIVIWLALIAIVGNGLSVLILAKGSKGNMNMQSAFLHLLSDTLFSVAVLAGGFAIKYFNIFWIDSALSIAIGIYLIASSWKLLRDSTRVLLQFVPNEINIPKLVEEVEKLKEVKNIHHVHVWQLDENTIHFEAHVDLKQDLSVSHTHAIQQKITNLLQSRFSIGHVTLQFEHGIDESKSLIQ